MEPAGRLAGRRGAAVAAGVLRAARARPADRRPRVRPLARRRLGLGAACRPAAARLRRLAAGEHAAVALRSLGAAARRAAGAAARRGDFDTARATAGATTDQRRTTNDR